MTSNTSKRSATAGSHARLFLGALLLAVLSDMSVARPETAPASAPGDAQVERYRFDVYLDERRIGSHTWEIRQTGQGETVVRSEADFDVRLLFFTAYEYEHRNAETWRQGCLVSLDAETNDNGKELAVTGEKTAEGFRVVTRDVARLLPDCVMSFAYWNPEFLGEARLLNPQTGQFVSVDVERKDEPGSGVAYTLRSDRLEVTVLYSADRKWIGLQAPRGDRTLRYVPA